MPLDPKTRRPTPSGPKHETAPKPPTPPACCILPREGNPTGRGVISDVPVVAGVDFLRLGNGGFLVCGAGAEVRQAGDPGSKPELTFRLPLPGKLRIFHGFSTILPRILRRCLFAYARGWARDAPRALGHLALHSAGDQHTQVTAESQPTDGGIDNQIKAE